jgi:hypothetical protein
MLLRAVRFLDTMMQRDALQKAAFLKDLAGVWPRVDTRVLKFRLLPPLLAEARCAALRFSPLLCCAALCVLRVLKLRLLPLLQAEARCAALRFSPLLCCAALCVLRVLKLRLLPLLQAEARCAALRFAPLLCCSEHGGVRADTCRFQISF